MIMAGYVSQGVSMLGSFNPASALLRDLAATFRHQVCMRESLAADLELDKHNDCSVRILKPHKAAGRGTGLSKRLKGQ